MTSNDGNAGPKSAAVQSNDKAERPKKHRQPTGHRAVGQRKPRPPGAKKPHPKKGAAAAKKAAAMKLVAAQAVELRARGFSLEAIAQRIGHKNKSSVHRLIAAEMAATPVEEIDTIRKFEARKLERLERKLNVILDDEDAETREKIEAIGKAIALSNRRCKLFGLDAPLQTEVTGKNGGPVAFEDISSAQDDIDKRLDQLSEELFGSKRPGATGGQRQPAAGAGPR
jgi:DNA-binding transcriptional MerR regulator